jgi:diketogulonate reductase-like aldo/keto reductase
LGFCRASPGQNRAIFFIAPQGNAFGGTRAARSNPMKSSIRRRPLLIGAAALAAEACMRKPNDFVPAANGCAGCGDGSRNEAELTSARPTSPGAVPTRPLGKTGANVSIVGIGGAHLDRGVNVLDNCWDYTGGASESRMGKALQDGYRERAFLMTKLDGRTKQAAAAQLEQSLRRLRTDRIDLVQIHEVIHYEDPAACFREGGCIEALLDARRAGKLRFIGFTGHKDPSIHLAMLDQADRHGFEFDTLQMPLNVLDATFKSFEKNVLPVANAKKMGVLGMKSLADGAILQSGVANAEQCLRYAMSLPVSTTITGCDSLARLDQALGVALGFQPYAPAQMDGLRTAARDAARDGRFERFKTTTDYDGTTQHPKWMTGAEL